MAVSSTHDSRFASASTTWVNEIQGGVVGSLSVLAVVLTLGLLAYAALGAAAPAVGLAATFVTAAVGGVIYALSGRSVMPTAGPSSATALILAALVHGLVAVTPAGAAPDLGLIVAGCGAAVTMAGLLQMGMAALGLSRLARLVPRPVLAGFMNGVALLILAGQVPLLMGMLPGASLDLRSVPQAFQPGALALGLGMVALNLLLHRARPRWPVALLALAVGTSLYAGVKSVWPGMPMGPTLGAVSVQWPDLLPFSNWLQPADRSALLSQAPLIGLTAVVLAVIGGLESAMNLLAHDQQQAGRHDPRRELLSLGAANVVCGALGGLPVVMLRARAMAIVQAGGRGRRAALAGSLALGLMYTVGGPLLALLPMPVLGAIMVTVALGLIDRWAGLLLLRWWRGENSAELRMGLLVMVLVCGVTLWKGFAAGVALGVLSSMTIFIVRMNRSLLRSRLTAEDRPSRRAYPAPMEALLAPQRRHIAVWELEGALFFGNADRLVALGENLSPQTRALILDLRRVTSIDETGAMALSTLGSNLQRRSMLVLVSGVAKGSAQDRALLAFNMPLQRLPDADRAIEAAEQQLLGPMAESTLTERPLGDSALLRGLSPEQVERVGAVMTERRLFAGETLFRQGDPADGLFVLSVGSVSVIGRDGHSTQRFLSISPGMMLGETAMLDGGGRSADAVADTFAVLHHLAAGDLQALQREHPDITSQLYLNIALHLSTRLRAASLAWWASQH